MKKIILNSYRAENNQEYKSKNKQNKKLLCLESQMETVVSFLEDDRIGGGGGVSKCRGLELE